MKALKHNNSDCTKVTSSIDKIRTMNPEVEEYLYGEESAAEEITAFIPTRYELEQIVKSWCWEILEEDWFFFGTRSASSIDASHDEFAKARIERIAEVLGAANVKKAIAKAREEFGNTRDPEAWQIFCHGDSAQWQAVSEDFRLARTKQLGDSPRPSKTSPADQQP